MGNVMKQAFESWFESMISQQGLIERKFNGKVGIRYNLKYRVQRQRAGQDCKLG